MAKGLIFDIKRYAIHDGPGIRTTVFFKGCPLRCTWCHNPEGQESSPEIIVNPERCGEECDLCLSVCPQDAISKDGNSIMIDRAKCDLCRKCTDVCVYEALKIAGQEVTDQEVLKEIEKDRIFFEESDGGLTCSGGEPMMQPDFLISLLENSKKKGIHTAVDTSGYASFDILDRVRKNTDFFLYDIKIMDDKKHKKFTGVSNRIILENLKKLSKSGTQIAVRIPVVPGINDDEKNIREIAGYLLSLKNIRQINLLPMHRGGSEKYKRLGKETMPQALKPPSEGKIERIQEILTDYGFLVKTGG